MRAQVSCNCIAQVSQQRFSTLRSDLFQGNIQDRHAVPSWEDKLKQDQLNIWFYIPSQQHFRDGKGGVFLYSLSLQLQGVCQGPWRMTIDNDSPKKTI